MNQLGSEYFLDMLRVEHGERLRAAEERRLAASLGTPGRARRILGGALIRLGLLVEGRSGAGTHVLVPAHRGGLSG